MVVPFYRPGNRDSREVTARKYRDWDLSPGGSKFRFFAFTQGGVRGGVGGGGTCFLPPPHPPYME